jgi:hypothetical protein
MMVAVRPEMIQTIHLMSQSLDKLAPGVNPPDAPKNRYVERVFWMPAKIDFRGLLGYFRFVLGRGADPISSGACFSDQLRTPARKGQVLLIRRSRRGN